MLGRTSLLARNAINTIARRGHGHGHGGTPGENLPFTLGNKYKMTAMFIAFFGSGMAIPFVVLGYQVSKK